MREALGITLTELAQRLKITPPAVRSFEQAEAEDRITLGSLRRSAQAMGCDLVYALVPRAGTIANTLTEAKTPGHLGREAPAAVSVSDPADDSTSKVTDKTWYALHGES